MTHYDWTTQTHDEAQAEAEFVVIDEQRMARHAYDSARVMYEHGRGDWMVCAAQEVAAKWSAVARAGYVLATIEVAS